MLKPAAAGAPTPGARQRALDARTLYIVPNGNVQVSSTGEALVVSGAQGDVHRLPIARLLRVVCSERVHWSGAALGLCQNSGVPVTWLGARGEPLGHLWPARALHTDLGDALEALCGLPGDWPDIYANWLRRQRFTVLQRWQQQRAAAGQPVGDDEWQRAKRAWVYRDQIAEHLPQILSGMIAALVASRLVEQGLLPRYWCAAGCHIELAQDVTRLIWAEVNLCGGALAEAMREARDVAALFESWSTRCADMAQVHLSALRAQALRELRR